MTTKTKIRVALLLAAISSTALFILLESRLGTFALFMLALLFVGLPAIYSWLTIATIGAPKMKTLLFFILAAALLFSVLLAMLRKNSGRYVQYASKRGNPAYPLQQSFRPKEPSTKSILTPLPTVSRQ